MTFERELILFEKENIEFFNCTLQKLTKEKKHVPVIFGFHDLIFFKEQI